ncbi:hypothetical protein ABZ896_21975 [Streptomyces sp. NPDC047072]|uniref:hypothetical protein n=1 Tax=Streptomyces sp. NPDC047072 TaxID=3154809 RepID=UPI0034033BAF
MVLARRMHKNAKRFSAAAGTVTALAVGGTLLLTPSASAADQPTIRQLVEACNTTSSFCRFHPQKLESYIGPNHQVGATVYNCGTGDGEFGVGGQDTTGSSDSVGVAITTSAGFEGVFEVAFETSYNHTWERSHTDTVEYKKHLEPGQKGWIERGTAKQKVTGWYEIQFKKRYYGHFDWYVYNYTESGFDTSHPSAGYTNLKSAPMTATERQQHCNR